jgi:hypothetical protein
MNKTYSVAEFLNIKKECFFCQHPLLSVVENFFDPQGGTEIPIISAPLANGKFIFQLQHNTDQFSIDVEITIDVKTNQLSFDPIKTSNLDRLLAKETLNQYDPHLESYCSNEKCNRKYYLSSDTFSLSTINFSDSYAIAPLTMFLEYFCVENLGIFNDHRQGITLIYAAQNPQAPPLKLPLIDFDSFEPGKLLNRIKTIVVFS